MNLANIGTLDGAYCMAYSIKERKCPMLFQREIWQRNPLIQFLFDKTYQEEYLVDDTWQFRDLWNDWPSSSERGGIQGKIDSQRGEKTDYSVYYYG